MRTWSRTLFSLGIGALGLAAQSFALVSGCSSATGAFGPLGTITPGDGEIGPFGSDASTPPVDAASAGDVIQPPPASEDAGPTTLLAVHASANLYDFRLCFGVVDGGILHVPAFPDDPSQPMPETNYPGVPVGGAVVLPAMQLPAVPIVPYLVRAQTLARSGDVSTNPTESTCDQLICGATSCLTVNSDYVALPAFTLPTTGGTALLAIEGCLPQGVASGSAPQCGGNYSAATGNLVAFATLLAPSDDAGVWTMQVAQLSPSFAQATGSAALTFVDPSIDASIPISAPATVGSPVTVPLSEAGVAVGYFVMNQVSAPLAESLASIQYFQAPSRDPFTYFSAPSAYFVAVVGDATDAAAPASLPDGAVNPAFDGHGLHVIAYPETKP